MTDLLAMHMGNELLSAPVAAVTIGVAIVAVALAVRFLANRPGSDKLPLMGVIGAFVFAAQMINITLPGTPGISGHVVGGVLLAILLGPAGGILVITAILIVQCLLFHDGGLLALGCNIINMGVVPSVLGWTVYRLVLGSLPGAKHWRIYTAVWAGCLVGVAGGAALVPVEVYLSGVLKIHFIDFFTVMVGVHLLIAFIEGLITFAVIAYLLQTHPGIVPGLDTETQATKPPRLGKKALGGSLLVTALLLAGLVSWFASQHPDGLEWAYIEHKYGEEQSAIENPSPLVAVVESAQNKWAPLPDYSKRAAGFGDELSEAPEDPDEGGTYPNVDGWGSLGGIVGTVVTLGILYSVTALLRKRKPKREPLGTNASS